MKSGIRMVAVDIDGTFVRSDYTYDVPRFRRILSRMKDAGCRFVVASGNQYYQLRDLFPGCDHELSFVAENGAFVKDGEELAFAASMPKETVDFVIDVCQEYPEVWNVLCGVDNAPENVKHAAKHVCPSNEEDGVLVTLEKIFF